MTKEFLEGCLADGLSLDQIGALTGRHPSTVSYHLKRHGLKPVGHDHHSPNGKVEPDKLRELVEAGASIHGVAEELGVSYTTVRHWVKKLGLETDRMIRLRKTRQATKDGTNEVVLNCATHGQTPFFKSPSGPYRCRKCRSEAVVRYRRRVKERLIERAGGCCQVCGYDRHPGALHFHHLDPAEKSFLLSRNGVTRAFAEVAAEAEKCVLLCGNCHAEVEAGVTELPLRLLPVQLRRGT
jgi:5-methylcytosine-specific restriction endonuclease McrA